MSQTAVVDALLAMDRRLFEIFICVRSQSPIDGIAVEDLWVLEELGLWSVDREAMTTSLTDLGWTIAIMHNEGIQFERDEVEYGRLSMEQTHYSDDSLRLGPQGRV